MGRGEGEERFSAMEVMVPTPHFRVLLLWDKAKIRLLHLPTSVPALTRDRSSHMVLRSGHWDYPVPCFFHRWGPGKFNEILNYVLMHACFVPFLATCLVASPSLFFV
jgi:hypothetical protein